MSDRNIQFLIKGWDGLTNDDEMVSFIDSLSQQETQLLDSAIKCGLLSKEPPYITKEAAQ
jgi:hypothetical protein